MQTHQHGNFLGLIFGPRTFLGLLEVLGIFWVLTFGSIRSSPSLEIPSTPPGMGGSLFYKFLLVHKESLFIPEHTLKADFSAQ